MAKVDYGGDDYTFAETIEHKDSVRGWTFRVEINRTKNNAAKGEPFAGDESTIAKVRNRERVRFCRSDVL